MTASFRTVCIVYETAYDGQLALMLAARLPLRT